MDILKAENVAKKYITKNALNDLSLIIETGKIYGLFGPNGSGKTTLMKMIAGLIRPTAGKIEVLENKIGTKTKELVSFMPTNNFIPRWMKIKDCLRYFDDLFRDFDLKKAETMIDSMGLNKEQKTKTLSTGMLGRLKLSLALSRKAKLYLLDEPLNGIDPVSREKIMGAILNTYHEENTIIISSHLVKELERILDYAVFLDKGNVVLCGDVEELRKEKAMSIDELYREVFRDA